jgi:hypothetical protein
MSTLLAIVLRLLTDCILSLLMFLQPLKSLVSFETSKTLINITKTKPWPRRLFQMNSLEHYVRDWIPILLLVARLFQKILFPFSFVHET